MDTVVLEKATAESVQLGQLFILPLSIEKAILANGESLNAALDLEKLKAIISKEDVAFYIYVNSGYTMGFLRNKAFDINQTFSNPVEKLRDKLIRISNDENADAKTRRFCKDVFDIIFVLMNKYNDVSEEHTKELRMDLSGDVLPIDYEVEVLREGLVVLKPRSVKEPVGFPMVHERELVSKLLGILCTVHKFAHVAKTLLFKRYVKLAS